jgi:fructose-1,6-bisphosphatase I
VVFASKDEGVKFFMFKDNQLVEQEPFTLNSSGKINSTAGIQKAWDTKHKALMESFFQDGYRLRFSDSLVLDTHQILFKKGGIYSNPASLIDPNGKLELVFEAYPIALIIELAGGKAIDGYKRILDIQHNTLHEKTPIYFGSADEVQRCYLK